MIQKQQVVIPSEQCDVKPSSGPEYGRGVTGQALLDRLGPALVAEIHQIVHEVVAHSESDSQRQTIPDQDVHDLER